MVVFAPGVSYNNLQIKAPTGLRIVIPKSNIQNAMSQVGTNDISSVQWGLKIYVCPQSNPACSSPTEAGEVDLIYNGSQFLLQLIISNYYASTPITLQYEFPEDLSNITDAIIDVYFDGENLTIDGNSKEIFDSDMLKTIGSVQQLTSTSAYLNSSGETVSGNNDYLTYNVQILPVADLSKILDIIIPMVLILPVIFMLPKIISKIKPAQQ